MSCQLNRYVCVCKLNCFHHIWLFVTLWTVARKAPLSMGSFRREYESGLPCPPPGDLPDTGIKPTSLKSPELAARFFTTCATWETLSSYILQLIFFSPSSNRYRVWHVVVVTLWSSIHRLINIDERSLWNWRKMNIPKSWTWSWMKTLMRLGLIPLQRGTGRGISIVMTIWL